MANLFSIWIKEYFDYTKKVQLQYFVHNPVTEMKLLTDIEGYVVHPNLDDISCKLAVWTPEGIEIVEINFSDIDTFS